MRGRQAIVKRIITFGTFDVFHVGHVNILERARALGDHLTVGVSSDALNIAKKGRAPVYSERHRVRIIQALRVVDHVFVEESLEKKLEYIVEHRADVLVMGSDWKGRFDEMREHCEVVYLPRTPSISTTEVIEVVRQNGDASLAEPADAGSERVVTPAPDPAGDPAS